MRAYLGLGSNQGDRWGHLRTAVAALPDVVAVSPVYETDPVGGPPGQEPYLNLVVALETDRSPLLLGQRAVGAHEAQPLQPDQVGHLRGSIAPW
ncbi:MAG TPA: 2-amino-4-hydroxy-6-hydroxymethyldihydropteridine diphosphokinase [Acidimicrobiales bacterium]|nr:2-amino-4-hydroxy-6-hydroxymethyldihydropteridine diphosphokinase [Acidimicrobiales bacterium]